MNARTQRHSSSMRAIVRVDGVQLYKGPEWMARREAEKLIAKYGPDRVTIEGCR